MLRSLVSPFLGLPRTAPFPTAEAVGFYIVSPASGGQRKPARLLST